MKYYTIRPADIGTSRIRVFNGNGVEAYYKVLDDYNVEGYCDCLQDFGYVNESFLKAEAQTFNFRDGLADSFGRY